MTARARRGRHGRHATLTPLPAAGVLARAAGAPVRAMGAPLGAVAAPDGAPAAPRGAARARGSALLAVASGLLLLLAAAQGYVSFRAQFAFVDHAKRAHLPSLLEALGLDTGAVIFALLALALARRGRRGAVERLLNVLCALGSLAMNLLAADLGSPRSITVWVLPSVLYALASDRLIAVVRRWVLSGDPAAARAAGDGSAWRAVGGLALWVLRLAFDLPDTVRVLRHWVLAAAPLPPGAEAGGVLAGGARRLPGDAGGAGSLFVTPEELAGQRHGERAALPGQPAGPAVTGGNGDRLAPGETKRAALIRLYEQCGRDGDSRYGERARAAAVAGEIAARIGYHPGTARRELARYLDGRPPAENGTSTEAVA